MRIDQSFGDRDIQPDWRGLNQHIMPVLRKMLAWINRHSHVLEFTQGDISGGSLRCEHKLSSNVVSVTLIDDAGNLRYDVLAAAATVVTVISDSEVSVDLSAVEPIDGTWKLLVRRD